MRILMDHQAFTMQEYGGISRYFQALLENNLLDKENSIINSTLFSNNSYVNANPHTKRKQIFPKNKIKGKQKIMNVFNTAYSKRMLKTTQFDIFHPTYYDTYFFNQLDDRPFVVTVYDMIHENMGGQYPELLGNGAIINQKKELILTADKIIAISHSTKTDILKLYDVDPEKISVIHLGNSLQANHKISAPIIDAPYLLFLSTRSVYKNFEFFLQSIAPLLSQSSMKMVCAGGGGFTNKELSLFKELKLSDLLVQLNVDDETLSNLYQNAVAFAFPSHYEGFGIPVLEAFANGCPCLLSNTSSLPEVGGTAAAYFDPSDAKSIYNTVSKVIFDKEKLAAMTELGYQRLKKFSWEETYRKTISCYKSILNQ